MDVGQRCVYERGWVDMGERGCVGARLCVYKCDTFYGCMRETEGLGVWGRERGYERLGCVCVGRFMVWK